VLGFLRGRMVFSIFINDANFLIQDYERSLLQINIFKFYLNFPKINVILTLEWYENRFLMQQAPKYSTLLQ
jgi:hypothetical protein